MFLAIIRLCLIHHAFNRGKILVSPEQPKTNRNVNNIDNHLYTTLGRLANVEIENTEFSWEDRAKEQTTPKNHKTTIMKITKPLTGCV